MNNKVTEELNLILLNIANFTSSQKAFDFVCNNLVLLNNEAINEETSLVCEMINFLQDNYDGIYAYDYDISKLIEKLSKQYILTKNELLDIKKEIELAHRLKNSFKSHPNKDSLTGLQVFFNNLFSLKEIRDKICNIISPDGEMLSSASVKYGVLLEKKSQLQLRSKSIEKNILKEYENYLIDKNIHLQEGKKTILVDISQKAKIYGNITSISSSGKGVYIEPKELISLNNELVIINTELVKEELLILKQITKVICKDLNILSSNQKIYFKLDLLFAKAKYAAINNMEKITLVNDKEIILKNARQPLIASAECVSINFTFTKDKAIYLITGANAGGKTVAMKTVFLLIEMTRRGLLVPCNSESKIYMFNQIYFDIGDNQSITNSLSTFQSHIKNINSIIKNASNNDLVILDELGSGTSPLEGQALAISILEYLKTHSIKTIISTHFPEVKKYGIDNEFVTCSCVSFDPDTLKPNYILEENKTGQSYGILLSKKFGLNKEIINSASKILDSFKTDTEKKYEHLEEKISEINKIKENLKIKDEELSNLKIKLENEYHEKIINLDKEYFNKYQEFETIIRELKKSKTVQNKSSNNFQKNAVISKEVVKKDFQIGDIVYVIPFAVHAKIEKIAKDNYYIKINGLLLNFKISELTYSNQKEITNKVYYHKKPIESTNKKSQISLELDLRGKRYIEVSELIEQKISDCIYHGANVLTIITGYGKGDVRKATISYLKTSAYVKEYSYAGEGSGLMGALKVYLK